MQLVSSLSRFLLNFFEGKYWLRTKHTLSQSLMSLNTQSSPSSILHINTYKSVHKEEMLYCGSNCTHSLYILSYLATQLPMSISSFRTFQYRAIGHIVPFLVQYFCTIMFLQRFRENSGIRYINRPFSLILGLALPSPFLLPQCMWMSKGKPQSK